MANQDIPSESAGTPAENGTSSPAARRRARPVRFTCVICGKEKPVRDIVRLDVVRPSLLDRIKETHPDLPAEGFICIDDLDHFRSAYVGELLRSERGELTNLEQEVVQSLADHETLAENIQAEFEGHRTFGERLSDHLATFGGSWSFLIIFGAVLVVWMAFNAITVGKDQFDPYPFILLNLLFSTQAAYAAPIIMMSQNRAAQRDRYQADADFRTNVESKKEIEEVQKHLSSIEVEKLDKILAAVGDDRLDRVLALLEGKSA